MYPYSQGGENQEKEPHIPKKIIIPLFLDEIVTLITDHWDTELEEGVVFDSFTHFIDSPVLAMQGSLN